MKNKLFCFLAFFAFLASWAQSPEANLPEIFPPSPTAAELGAYGTYPVDLSTGLPQIEIPLYTIKAGEIEVPIKLKYHASGIKVNQNSSWVGLGWALEAGGLISLEVRDTPDELEPSTYSIPNDNYIQNIISEDPYNFDRQNLKDLLRNSWVKDAYHIQLPTVQGTFFGPEGSVKFPPEEYIVEKRGPGPQIFDPIFKVIDKNGMQYHLNEEEKSKINKTNNQPGTDNHIYNTKYTSAWLLSSIISPKKDTVRFEYGNHYTVSNFGESHSQTYYYKEGEIPNEANDYYMGVVFPSVPYHKGFIDPVKKLHTPSETFANKLTSITFPNGRLRFVTKTNSQYGGVKDAAGIYLEQIIIEKGNDEEGYTIMKMIFFDYSITGQGNHYTTTNTTRYRFQLDRVREVSALSLGNKTIAELEYNDTNLPKKGSNAVDYFGFYNGHGNSDLIPERFIWFYPNSVGSERRLENIGNGNRNINPSLMQAGMLKKITYPTQGYTTFNYEPNSYYGKNKFLRDEYVTSSIGIIGEGDGMQDPAQPYECLPSSTDCPIQIEVFYLTLNEPTTLSLTGNRICDNCSSDTNSKYSYAKVTVINGGEEVYSSGGFENKTYSEYIPIVGGNTTVRLKVYGDRLRVGLNIGYFKKLGDLPNENVQGFGLRVKNITNYDQNGSFINQKEYDYNQPGTSKSSGVLVNNIQHYNNITTYKTAEMITYQPLEWYQTDYTTHSSSSKTGFESNSIAYEYVTETDKDSLGNAKGKTVNKYSVNENFVSNFSDVWVDKGNERGRLLTSMVYDDEHILLREENIYSSSTTNINTREDFKAELNHHSNFDPSNNITGVLPYSLNDVFIYTHSFLSSSWYKKDHTRRVEYFYDNATVDSLVTDTDYRYNSTNQEVNEVETTSSQGVQTLARYRYAADLNEQELLQANRISIPLEEISYRGNELMYDKLTTYGPQQGNYLPEAVHIKKGGPVTASGAHERLRYKRYDTYGNPLEVEKPGGKLVSYIWGYAHQNPIAKIENATYAEVASILGSGFENALEGTEANLTPSQKDNLRASLPQANITFYTYRPLVGISEITDPGGYTTYYQYDDFNRLKYIKDDEGKVLKEYNYNYRD